MAAEVWNKQALIKVLKGDVKRLSAGFTWSTTLQGYDYWFERCTGKQKLTQEDREYLFSLLLEKTHKGIIYKRRS